jgi:MFS family permease
MPKYNVWMRGIGAMDHADDKNARRKLRLAILFAAVIFTLVLAAAQIAIHRPPMHVVFIFIGVAGMLFNIVTWILLSGKARKEGKRMGLNLSFIAASIASAVSIAYGFGESHFSQYTVYIVIACILVSCLIKVCSPAQD